MNSRIIALFVLCAGALAAGCSSPPVKPAEFTLGGTVTGLAGTSVVLQDEGAYSLTITKNGPFTFPQTFSSSTAYFITVLTQPTGPDQTCTLTGAQGFAGTANVTSIDVTCTTNTFAVGGSVSGLAGTGLVLEDNGGDDLVVAGDGTFAFATPVANGAPYAVSVKAQPAMPTQTCAVSSGSGTVGVEPITNVLVTCTTSTFAIGGSISGLMGTGLVLEDNGGDDLTISSGATFAFATPIASGGTYSVTVKTQPTSPTQTCTVSGGSGTVVAGAVTSITVNCASNTYTVGGVVIGLAGTGLVLQDNGGDNLSVTANGLFAFATPVASGAAYDVTVLTQPAGPTQTCTVSGAMGTVATGNVISVSVNCAANTYALSGTITGLKGAGLVLQDNGGNDLSVMAGATTFSFTSMLASGATYAIAVAAQPTNPTQTCVVSNDPSGTVGSAPITDIVVTCTSNTYSVGGTVIGLLGTGLVLQDNGGDNDAVAGNGLFSFATPVASGAKFAVTVATQPSNPAQTCVVSGGTGTVAGAEVNSVTVNCASNQYAISGTTVGLVGSGLKLSLNGMSALAVQSNGTFSFAQTLASGAPYAVSVVTQPSNPTQTCVISGGAGTVGGANVTSIVVNCGTDSYTVGGAVTGLAGSGLVLQDNSGDNLSVGASGLFSFATPLASGSAYSVTVLTQPTSPAQTCTVSGGSGAVGMGNVVSVVVACATNTFSVSGTISGFAGTGLVLQDNGGDNIAVMDGATTFTFATPVASGGTYAVGVATQPSSPSQTCVVSSAANGTVGNAAVTDVVVTCTTNTYAIGGTVLGMAGSGLVLEDNGGDDYTVTGNGVFTFATPVASEATFSVTILTQPSSPAQTCVVTGASGTVVNAAVSTVTVNCGLNGYTVSGTTSGLLGTGLVLSLNGGPGLAVESNGTFSFPQALTDGAAYAVAVSTQPTGPSQTCTLSGASGTIAAASVSSLVVSCSANNYPITVTATGVAGSGLVLEDNGGDSLAIPANGTYTFATLVASGATYAVTVADEPTSLSQTCVVTNGSGTVAGAVVSNILVACTTNKYTVGGTISGLAGTVVLQDNGADTLILTPPAPVPGAVIADAGMFDGGSGDEGIADGGSTDGGSTDGGTIGGGGGGGLAFIFSASVASGSPYAVTVSQQPGSPSQTCIVSNDPSGTMTSTAVTDVAVVCTTNTFSVDVTVVGLAGTGLIIGDNVGDMVPVSSNGVVTLPTKQASATTYSVTVISQPTGPAQTCAVLGGTGTVGGSDVTGITVNCALNSYTVSGTIAGLAGTGLVMADNVGDSVPISGNGMFSFPTPYASGAPYAVTVGTQPQGPWQTCTVTNGTGSVGTGNVTNVSVACTNNTYNVSVNLNGLSGGGLQLADNASDVLSVTQNGLSTFAVPVASGASYAVTVVSQPTSLWQTCTIGSGTGTIAGSTVTVNVNCTNNNYVINVAVTGLLGSGLKLLDNGGDTLSATGNSTFPFATSIASGGLYDVTVATQPSSPTQSCVVAAPTGTVGGAPVTVAVSCGTSSFTVGGTITGLAASESVQLTNATDTISVAASGAFTFDKSVASGATYSVSVTGQPTSPVAQTCTVVNGSGTIGGGNVTNIAVTCAQNTYTVGGTLSGYSGAGLVLSNNGGSNLTIAAGATAFTWPTPLSSGASYVVGVGTQPSSPWQTCTVANASGTIAGANVTNVAVACTTNPYTIGGAITGLAPSESVQLTNGTDSITVSANGTFTFDKTVASGATYSVSTTGQPASPVAQTCTVTNGSGTVTSTNVTAVAVTCSQNAYTIGGTISGYSGTGLVLANNGGASLTVSSGATTFTWPTPLSSGAGYVVSVGTQPTSPWQACTVANASGTVAGANVTNVAITCTTNTYTIGGTVTGLAGSASLVLQDNTSSNTVTVSSGATFQFPAAASGSSYSVTVQTQPSSPTETCAVSNGTGTIAGSAVTNISVSCSTSSFTIGGSISGYSGSGLQLLLNGSAAYTATSAASSFTFGSLLASGSPYAVTIAAQPTTPTQSCTVTNGTGTVGSSNVTSVAVACTTSSFTVGGEVSGLAGGNVVLQDVSFSNTVTVSSNGAFSFPAQASGSSYAVTVQTQPSSPAQTCAVTSGTGTVAGAAVTNVVVSCTTTAYTIGGSISGYSGSGLQLQLNGANTLSVTSGATSFTFSSPTIASAATYAVSVLTQPTSPTQSCTVTSGSGTVGSANVTSVAIACTTTSFTVGGTVTGLSSNSIVLQNNTSSNTVTVSSNGTFSFPSQASGSTYAVTIKTLPVSPTEGCSVVNGSGTVTTGSVTNIVVACTTANFTVGGTISGLTGSGTVLLLNGANNLAVSAGATSFSFGTQITSGGAYAVTIGTAPSTPTQTCTVSNGTGTVGSTNITNVAISCTTNTYSISATVTGSFSGTLVIEDNGSSPLSFTSTGTGTFGTAIASGATYSVTISSQPSTGSCSVANGSGTVTNTNVTNVTVTCLLGPSGSGTASSPYTTSPPLANCTVYKSTFGTQAPSGVYTTDPSGTPIQVWCDMTGSGLTYQGFGFGQYTASFSGWALTSVSSFQSNAQFQNAFVYLYNRNGGLTNLNPGWNSSNCCFVSATGGPYYGFNGQPYMYPANAGGTSYNCNSGYSDTLMWVDPGAGTVLGTVTTAELADSAASSDCGESGNPGIFVQSY